MTPLDISNFNPGDFCSDTILKISNQIAEAESPSTPIKDQKLDSVESITRKIFENWKDFLSLKEELKNDLEDMAAEPLSPSKHPYTDSSAILEPDSNFSDLESWYPISTQAIIVNIIHGVANFFFGWKLSKKEIQKNVLKMEGTLTIDEAIWNAKKNYYNDTFQNQMNSAFKVAHELLRRRKEQENTAIVYRAIFYSGLVVSAFGKRLDSNLLFAGGMVLSLFTCALMARNFFTPSLDEICLETELRDLTKTLGAGIRLDRKKEK